MYVQGDMWIFIMLRIRYRWKYVDQLYAYQSTEVAGIFFYAKTIKQWNEKFEI